MVESHATALQLVTDVIAAQYNLYARQNQVLNYLDGLSIERLRDTGFDESAALAKLYAEIVRISPQLPTSHKGDDQKDCFMRRAVSSRPWSYPALQRVASRGMLF